MTKKALIDENNDVQNVIIADEGYEHPDSDTLPANGRQVQPGDYYEPDTDEFVTPRLSISSPDTLANDGSTEATVEVTTTARDTQEATITIEDLEKTAEVTPDGSHTETITTTASAGTFIEVKTESDKIKDAFAKIEVTN